jgi:hypothetical protein
MSKEEYYSNRIKELLEIDPNSDDYNEDCKREDMEELVKILYKIYDRVEGVNWNEELFELYPASGHKVYTEQHYTVNGNAITILGTYYTKKKKIEFSICVNDKYEYFDMENGSMNEKLLLRLKELLVEKNEHTS